MDMEPMYRPQLTPLVGGINRIAEDTYVLPRDMGIEFQTHVDAYEQAHKTFVAAKKAFDEKFKNPFWSRVTASAGIDLQTHHATFYFDGYLKEYVVKTFRKDQIQVTEKPLN